MVVSKYGFRSEEVTAVRLSESLGVKWDSVRERKRKIR